MLVLTTTINRNIKNYSVSIHNKKQISLATNNNNDDDKNNNSHLYAAIKL